MNLPFQTIIFQECVTPDSGTSKVNTRTEGLTYGHTDGRTFRLIESIGSEGRCFENIIMTELPLKLYQYLRQFFVAV